MCGLLSARGGDTNTPAEGIVLNSAHPSRGGAIGDGWRRRRADLRDFLAAAFWERRREKGGVEKGWRNHNVVAGGVYQVLHLQENGFLFKSFRRTHRYLRYREEGGTTWRGEGGGKRKIIWPRGGNHDGEKGREGLAEAFGERWVGGKDVEGQGL